MGDDLRGKLGEHNEGRVNPSLDIHRILEVMDVLYFQVCGFRNGDATRQNLSISESRSQLIELIGCWYLKDKNIDEEHKSR